MNPDQLLDEELLYIVGQTDTELFKAGMDIKQREWEVPNRVMQKFGYVGFVRFGSVRPPILERIEKAFASIYRQTDLAIGGHIGVYLYKDIFARISIPYGFGTFGFSPLDYVELTKIQKRIITSEPEEIETFLDQFSDVADVQYGSEEIKKPYSEIELVKRFFGLSRLHLHAASAIVTGGYDFRGAVQSSLLATELALKAGAATQGLSEKELADRKRFGHNFPALVDFLGNTWPAFDADRVRRVVSHQPEYVPNRYSETQPQRRAVGHIIMGAQYIAAEVVRQLSNINFRNNMKPSQSRRYPN